MIVSNIHKDQDGTFQQGSRFYKVADNIGTYVGLTESTFSIHTHHEGRDHFTHTMRYIDELWRVYSNNPDVSIALHEINGNIVLKRWFAALICMMIYGAADGYRLRINSYSTEDRSFLDIWKRKFIINGKDDNSIDSCNGMNVYEFVKNEKTSVIGCFSNKYCVISVREVVNNGNKWEELFSAILHAYDLKQYFKDEIPIVDLIKIKFSSVSLPDNTPIKIIKDIISSIVNLDIQFDYNIPHQSVGYLNVYCTDNNVIPKSSLCNDIYLTRISNNYAALYPLRNDVADDIEIKIASVKNLEMKVFIKNNIITVSVSSEFCYRVVFKPIDNDGQEAVVPFSFTEMKSYTGDSIKSADNIGTFCAYPDIPLEYEHRCKQYTYFYDLNSNLSGNGESADLELSDVAFKKAYNNDKLYLHSSNQPIHIFKVSLSKTKYSSKNRYAGCIINIRHLQRQCLPPLLISGEKVDIDLNIPKSNSETTMKVYMDFGSSSSTIGYKIENSQLILDDITGGTPVVRELLGRYDKARYSCFMNLPSLYRKKGTVPSTLIEFCGEEFGVFSCDNTFLPFKLDSSKIEENHLKICDVHKSDLAVRGKTIANHLSAVVENLCYMALCHAISCNCGKVVFIQSFPNDEYKASYAYIMDSFCVHMKNTVFPDLNVNHVINCDNNYLLYESLAISNSVSDLPNNILLVNVDIGDATTDFASVYCSNNSKKVCGYSSIDYAGKQLLKRSVCDMLLHSGNYNNQDVFLRKITEFMLGTQDIPPFFTSGTGETDSLKDHVSALCKRFLMDVDNNGFVKSSAWENIFLEILEYADINVDVFKVNKKIKEDLILRYAFMIPVIKDFIETSLNACDNPEGISVNLTFYGGGSKGIGFINSLTGDFINNIAKYLQCTAKNVNVTVSTENAKEQIIIGLERLDVINQNDGKYNVVLSNAIKTEADWKYINPKYTDSFKSASRQEKCAQLNIIPIQSSDSNINHNIEQRKKTSNFFNVEAAYDEMGRQICEIIDFFMPSDREQSLFKKIFLDGSYSYMGQKVKNTLISSPNNELSSFTKASDAEIYPEMIKNTAYLFEISRLMSQFFGLGFDDKCITNTDDYKNLGGKQDK